MWRRVCLGAVLMCAPGCSKILGIEDITLGTDAQLPIDAPGIDARLCYGSGLAPICLTTPPVSAKTLDLPIDTASNTACTLVVPQTGGPDLCVIAAGQITVSATVVATGTRALVLLGTEIVNVNGTLDVSSKRSPARVGAGGNFTACGAGTLPGNRSTGAAGGAGGTFGTKGASGGDGDGALALNGVSPAVLPLTFVRGGCKAQDGGDAGTVQGGLGGAGGGAVYIIAGSEITIAGNIYASGAGGAATGLHGGGGGGGAGGLIGLEAPSIILGGILAANGANGSAGSGTTTVGAAGADGATVSYATPSPATTNGSSGGIGGVGKTGAALVTVGGNGPTGAAGGGGGGGAGTIWVKGTFSGTKVSPTPTMN